MESIRARGAVVGAREVSQFLALSLAVNLMWGQVAVTRQSWFGADKIKHFFLAAFVESVTFSALRVAGVNRSAALAGALGTTTAVSVGREFYNRRTTGFSVPDLAWDAAGAGAAFLLLRHTTK